MDQFQDDSAEADSLSYIDENVGAGRVNTTPVQGIVGGDNVLAKQSLLGHLRVQQRLRWNETVHGTLAEGSQPVGIGNLVVTAAIRQRGGGVELRARARALDKRRARLTATLDKRRARLTATLDRLNASWRDG